VSITTSAPASLTEEMRAVECEYPGWLLHLSEQGSIWIDSVSGVPSLRAATPLHARRVIAEWEHLMDVRYGPGSEGTCARPGCTHDHGSHWDGTGRCGFCDCDSYVLAAAS
jgi:hypothetical protein